MPVNTSLTSLENFDGIPTFVSNNTRYGGGQGASQNTDIIRQGTGSGGRRVDNSTGGLGASLTSTDLSGPGQHIKAWVSITQWAQVNSLGVVIASGNAASAGDIHIVPTNEFPVNGGFIPVWIDVSRTADVGGPANEASINEVGIQVNIGDVGGNAQNVILDEIHHGTTGLVFSGTLAPTNFTEFRNFETTNSIGVLQTINGIDFCYSRLEYSDQDGVITTSFNDSGFTIAFPDQSLVSDTFMGVTIHYDNFSSSMSLSNATIQSADVVNATKRPDFIVDGTDGTVTFDSLLLLGMRTIDFNSTVTFSNGTIDTLNLTQNGAEIQNSVINTRSSASVACLTDPTFGTTTDLHDVTFIQQGLGHALELDTATTYNLTNIFFNGYGADSSTTSAIDVSATSGTVTININGGDTPTFTSAGATVVINNSVSVRIVALDTSTGLPIQGARVYLIAGNGGDLSSGTVILNALTDVNGVVEDSGFNFTNDQPVIGRVRKGSTSPLYKTSPIQGIITNIGLDNNIFLISDE